MKDSDDEKKTGNSPIEDELRTESKRFREERDAVIITCSDMGSLYAKMQAKLEKAKDNLKAMLTYNEVYFIHQLATQTIKDIDRDANE